jgi:hypothetical protein
MSTRLTVALLGVLFAACSGGASSSPQAAATGDPSVRNFISSSDQDGGTAAGSAPDEEKRSAALARLRSRQQAACEQVATGITDCAVADAEATLSPEELAKLDLKNTAPQHRAAFLRQCLASDMSPRQVKVFEDCLADTSCPVFLECLDQAKPGN